jgi:excisionase family DNA binding protein
MDEITVDEAAAELGVSVATVKRLCANGELDARKVGRSWFIVGRAVENRRRTTAPASPKPVVLDVDRALGYVEHHDLQNDVWVPDVLAFADELSDRQGVVDEASRRIDRRDFASPIEVKVPKSPFFPRNATDLTLADRVAYQAATQRLAPAIDSLTSPAVYSARLATSGKDFLKDGRDGWLAWMAQLKRDLKDRPDAYVISTDITCYFDYIKHEVLLPEIERLPGSKEVLQPLREMVRTWSTVPNTGIPQGPNASRILGNFYLVPVDDAVETLCPRVTYSRYMDDIRIIAESRHEALTALQVLDDACRRRGLNLSNQKTHLHTGSQALDELADNQIDQANYVFVGASPEEAKRKILRKLLDLSLSAQGNVVTVNGRRAKFALWRLYRMRDAGGLRTALRNLESLAPFGRLVGIYLHPFSARPSTQRRIAQFLVNPERNTSEYLSSWLLAMFADYGRNVVPEIVDYARAIARDANSARYHRFVALYVLGTAGRDRDRAHLAEMARRDLDPGIVRSALVALHRSGQLTKADAATAVRRYPELRATTTYLNGRATVPSMLFRGKQLSCE